MWCLLVLDRGMTMGEVLTVWRATSAAQSKVDKAEGNRVRVTTVRPEDGDLVFELHVPEEDLVEVGDGVFEMDWSTIGSHPYQVTAS